jgi:holo-[acyl-carrier protein] synthase
MIVGVGIDVIEVERMRKTVDRHGSRFLDHVFAPSELDRAPEGPAAAAYFAGRWAAKEAVSKALGTGIGRDCAWTDIRILRDPTGKPLVDLHGAGAATAARLCIHHVHLSISHTGGLACATAVAERIVDERLHST